MKQGKSVKVENREIPVFLSGRTRRDVPEFFGQYRPSLPDTHLRQLHV